MPLMLKELVCSQIHKQAPPLEDIAEDCSPGMRELIEAALERNPNHRPRAADLLKHEALNPPREDQPRCQSLDSALFERKRLLSRKELELPENIAGMDTLQCAVPWLPFFSVSIHLLIELMNTPGKTNRISRCKLVYVG